VWGGGEDYLDLQYFLDFFPEKLTLIFPYVLWSKGTAKQPSKQSEFLSSGHSQNCPAHWKECTYQMTHDCHLETVQSLLSLLSYQNVYKTEKDFVQCTFQIKFDSAKSHFYLYVNGGTKRKDYKNYTRTRCQPSMKSKFWGFRNL
jgi:hypothetical protein